MKNVEVSPDKPVKQWLITDFDDFLKGNPHV
jgi:hypothetical protein